MSAPPTAAPESRVPRGLSPAEDGSRTLLIVDDDEGPRQALSILFRDVYEIHTACDGRAALELARERLIDAAIVDIRMPGLSGIETLAALKEIDPDMEVVILTAHESLETARKALRMGARDYVSKPFEIDAMRATVAAAMERRRISEGMVAGSRELEELRRLIHETRMSEKEARAKGEIYASVIHDINGPMTVISGFVDIVNSNLGRVRRLDDAGLEELKVRLAQITRQVDACINISQRYLAFFREQREGDAAVGVQQILDDLIELLRVHPAARGNHLSLESLDRDCSIAINGTDLIQCLLNLSINALQSSARPHEVRVVGRRHEEPVDLDVIAASARARIVNREGFINRAPLVSISVEDDGDGIPDEVAGRLFGERLTTKSEGEGTGLGLAIVGRMVREAGGAIVMKTEPGAGTVFTLYFPSAD